ncbi:hypothetical protein D3C85_1676800 [compost metagenome]
MGLKDFLPGVEPIGLYPIIDGEGEGPRRQVHGLLALGNGEGLPGDFGGQLRRGARG